MLLLVYRVGKLPVSASRQVGWSLPNAAWPSASGQAAAHGMLAESTEPPVQLGIELKVWRGSN